MRRLPPRIKETSLALMPVSSAICFCVFPILRSRLMTFRCLSSAIWAVAMFPSRCIDWPRCIPLVHKFIRYRIALQLCTEYKNAEANGVTLEDAALKLAVVQAYCYNAIGNLALLEGKYPWRWW